MKIAIMTQPLGKNYGGIMQAWALQQVLKRMGHQPVTIDRQENPKGYAYNIARLGYRAAMKAIGKRSQPINIERKIKLYFSDIVQNTQSFIDQNIEMSEVLDSTKKLKDHFINNGYGAVIVGSDQTWRPRYSANIYNYFLDFLESEDIKRIAYASSFGVDDWEYTKKQTRKCGKLATYFDAISVRENSGVSLCHKYLGVDASFVLDPTLLIEKNDYIDLIGKERVASKDKGVYTYFLDKNRDKESFSESVAHKLNENVFSSQAEFGLSQGIVHDLDSYILPDVKDWISGFANARVVLTDSFHGMVFSIIFNKPFFVFSNHGRGQARFISLLDTLNMRDRLLETSAEVNWDLLLNPPIHELNSLILGDLKYKSMKLLVDGL